MYDGEVSLIKADKSAPRNIYISTQHGILTIEDTISDTNGGTNHKTPGEFLLYQNYPNPFNPTTIIKYELRITSDISLRIYNLLGQKVATLVDSKQSAGRYQVEWNASGFPSGVYYYQFLAGDYREVKKMIFLK